MSDKAPEPEARRLLPRGLAHPALGMLGVITLVLVGWALARQVFEFQWTAAPWVPVAGALAGAVLAWLAGWWGLREVLLRPVIDTLRRAAE